MDRIRQRSLSWSTRFLSRAGKLTLLKAVLQAIPTYTMSCFQIPISLCKRIQTVLTRFWWDGPEGTKKMCWVSWDRLTNPKAMGGLGLRDIQLFNQALLAKLAWRIITVPDCLLARILKGKYCQRQGFLDTNLPSACSHGWRSIIFGRDLLKDNIGKAIGNGQTTAVWKDSWISLDDNVKPYGPIQEEGTDLMVSDLLTDDLNWNRARVEKFLPELSTKIMSLHPSRSGMEDRFIWQPLPTGTYSTRSGYFSASKKVKEQSTNTDDNFNWIREVWRHKCSPKLRLFLWSIINNALPLGENLQKRGILSATNCTKCNEQETKMHIFFTCPFAMEVWKSIPLRNAVHIAAGMDFKEALLRFKDAVCLPPTGIVGSILPWVLWSLWTSRNALLFDSKEITPEETATTGLRLALEWNQAQDKRIKSNPLLGRARTKNNRSTTAPLRNNSISCKTDAAWNETRNKAGLAWNFSCPQVSRTIIGSSTQEFISSPLVAEALAVRAAMEAAKELGFINLNVFSDSTTLIGEINGRIQRKELIGIISDIQSISSGFTSLPFSHIPRLENSLSDSIAKEALHHSVTSYVAG